MKTLLLITFAVVFFLTGIDRTYALPVQWSSASGGNDHWYEVVNHGSGVSWDEAKALAESSTYLGLQGHLVTITSAAEDAFVLGFPVVGIQTWLGGFQDPGASSPDAGWRWVTGEAWSYTNWGPGEPNDFFGIGSEDKLGLFTYSSVNALWNDYLPNERNIQYVVEYERVPEPAVMFLLPLGLLGFAVLSRKFKVL